MEYVYTAMLLHKSGEKIDEINVKKVLEAANVKVNEARVKALVATLEGVNIDEAIEKAAVPVAIASAAPAEKETKKVETLKKVEEDKKSEEQAAAGLGALFG